MGKDSRKISQKISGWGKCSVSCLVPTLSRGKGISVDFLGRDLAASLLYMVNLLAMGPLEFFALRNHSLEQQLQVVLWIDLQQSMSTSTQERRL